MESQEANLGALPPYSNTGVIDNPKNGRKPSIQEGFDLIIDFFSFTFSSEEKNITKELSKVLPKLFPDAIEWIPDNIDWDGDTELGHFVGSIRVESRKGGKFGYLAHSAIMYGQEQIGVVAWGGKSQQGRILISISGQGCTHLDYSSAHALMLSLSSSRITRCDIALDDYMGAFPVHKAMKWDWSPKNGPSPSLSAYTSRIEGKQIPTSVYVGSKKSGKYLNAYHKGIERGLPEIPWQRYELRMSNDQVEIPFDVLVNPKPYFLGAYPILHRKFKKILDCVQVNPFPSKRKSCLLTLAKKLENHRSLSGGFIHFLRNLNVSDSDIVSRLERPAQTPNGIQSFGLSEAVGVIFPSVQTGDISVTCLDPIPTIGCKQPAGFSCGKENPKNMIDERRN